MENIWLWEGSDENRNYTTLDKYTTHDAKGCVPAGDSQMSLFTWHIHVTLLPGRLSPAGTQPFASWVVYLSKVGEQRHLDWH
jgi:hypothetical protein